MLYDVTTERNDLIASLHEDVLDSGVRHLFDFRIYDRSVVFQFTHNGATANSYCIRLA